MTRVLVFLVTVVSLSLARDYSYCTVPQFEGYQSTTGAVYRDDIPTIVQSLTWIAYDQNNTQMALHTSGTTSGVPFEVEYIYDYQQGVLYIIEGETCQKSPLTQPFGEGCIPKGAVMTWGKTWLGGAGRHDELWILGFTGREGNVTYHIAFNQFPLVPVFQTLSGDIHGDPFFQTSQFMNVTIGIADPSVFIPPPSCKRVGIQNRVDMRVHHGLFSL